MDLAIALHAAAAVLLVIAGSAKLGRPSTAVVLLSSLGAPESGPFRGERVAVVLGAVEAAVGIAALAIGGTITELVVGLLYVGFAVAVMRALTVGVSSCGCFGRVDAPPSPLHVFGNSVLAGASFIAIDGPSPLDVMEEQPAGGIGFVVVVGVLAGLALVLFTALPEALATRHSTGGS